MASAAIGCSFDFWVDRVCCADSPGYGGYQTATPPPYYTTTYATTSYYTENAQLGLQLHHQGSRCTTTYAAPSYYTAAPKYFSSPIYTTKAHVHTSEARKYYTNQGTWDYTFTYAVQSTTALRHRTTTRLYMLLNLRHRGSSLLHHQSGRTQWRPSTMEISRVSISTTQHGSPEVSNKLRFKQWYGEERRWALYYCNFVEHVLMTCFSF
jgi:hypothetical protein